MRPARIRALLEPRVQQRAAGCGVTLVPRQVPGLRERQQLGMTARLPQVLDVADDPFVAIVQRLAEGERRNPAGLRITVPGGRKAELCRPQREDVELAGDDAIGRRAVLARVELLRQRIDPRTPGRIAGAGRHLGCEQPEALQGAARLLPDPVADLAAIHRGEPVEFPANAQAVAP